MMQNRIFLITALLASAATTTHAEHVLDSKASYIDVKLRRNELKNPKEQRVRDAVASLPSCVKLQAVEAPVGRMAIPAHYLNGSHGEVNKKEIEATRVYLDLEKRVTAGMNQWLARGDEAEATCAMQQLDIWARADALTDYSAKESPQAWYQATWTLGSVAIAESVLVNDPKLDKTTQARIIAWMNKAAHKIVDFDKPSKQRNNLHYWRGLAATAVGVISSDDALFTYGTATVKEAVDEIDQRGALPQEMKRNERAIHYQAFALQPLISIAMFAERQNIFLFTYSSLNGRKIFDAVEFLSDAIAKPEIVHAYISDKQMTDFDAQDFVAWAELLAHRFRMSALPAPIRDRLRKPTYATRIGGNMTVVAGPVKAEKP